jgi:hypothetical protein
MGDRAHVVIDRTDAIDDHPPLYVYVHDMGTRLPEVVAKALERVGPRITTERRRGRLNDPAYTARVVVDEVTAERMVNPWSSALDEANSCHYTGVGISTTLLDDSSGRRVVVQYDDARGGPPTVKLVGYDYATMEYPAAEFIDRYAPHQSAYDILMNRAGKNESANADLLGGAE